MTYSVYIPRVFENITKKRICDAFETNGIGIVERIDLVSTMGSNGKTYNSAFVHFTFWYDSSHAIRFWEKVQDPTKQARLVYDDPWFWIVLPNTGKLVVPGERKECLVCCVEKEKEKEKEKSYEIPTPTTSLVDSSYVDILEQEIRRLRCENKIIQDELHVALRTRTTV